MLIFKIYHLFNDSDVDEKLFYFLEEIKSSSINIINAYYMYGQKKNYR